MDTVETGVGDWLILETGLGTKKPILLKENQLNRRNVTAIKKITIATNYARLIWDFMEMDFG